MGYPIFTWMPIQGREVGAADDRRTIQLDEDLSDLQVKPGRTVYDLHGMHGGRSRSLTRAWIDVRIVLERFTDRRLATKFKNMVNHLERGGSIAFSLDNAKVWGSYTTGKLFVGNLGVSVEKTNIYKAMAPTTAPDIIGPTDDYFCIEDQPPRAARDHLQVNASSPPVEYDDRYTIFSTLQTQNDFTPGTHVRHEDFYPKLVLPQEQVGGAMITHDHRISYTLDLNLRYIIPKRKVLNGGNQNTVNENQAGSGRTAMPDYDPQYSAAASGATY